MTNSGQTKHFSESPAQQTKHFSESPAHGESPTYNGQLADQGAQRGGFPFADECGASIPIGGPLSSSAARGG